MPTEKEQLSPQQLSDEQLNIAIAEALGLNPRIYAPYCSVCRETVGNDEVFEDVHQKCGGKVRHGTKNYCGDLNAMHEAEKSLGLKESGDYEKLLDEVVNADFISGQSISIFPSWHASARQRAETFAAVKGAVN